jgi:hypothetical protein
MSTVANCPKCKTEIGIPEGVDLSRRARCPHCKSEFTLQEAIDSAAAGATDVSEEKKNSTAERPSWKAKWAKKTTPVSDQGVPDPLANAERGAEADEPWHPPEGSQAQQTQRERKARNPVVELVKMTLGGVLGLAVGYGILLWVFKTDPFDLAKYLPAVLVPDAVKAGAAGGNAAVAPNQNGVAAGKKVDPFAQPKPGEQANAATSKRPELPPLKEPTETPEQLAAHEGPKNIAVSMMADLVRGMAEANDAQTALDQARGTEAGNGTSTIPGSVELKAIRQMYYDRLAKLAEIVTLLPKSPDRDISRRTAAEMVLQGVGERVKLEELAALATERMNSGDEAKSGIVLAGTVKSVEPMEEQFRTVIELTNQKTDVPVISAEKPEVAVNDTAIVLGAIVADPEHNLWHYSGHDPQVVWSGAILKVAVDVKDTDIFK